jgi:hypothetical protein
VHVTDFINHDRGEALTRDPAMSKNRMLYQIIPRAKVLRIAQVDDQLHRAIWQNHVTPADRQITAHHPEMFDVCR